MASDGREIEKGLRGCVAKSGRIESESESHFRGSVPAPSGKGTHGGVFTFFARAENEK